MTAAWEPCWCDTDGKTALVLCCSLAGLMSVGTGRSSDGKTSD